VRRGGREEMEEREEAWVDARSESFEEEEERLAERDSILSFVLEM